LRRLGRRKWSEIIISSGSSSRERKRKKVDRKFNRDIKTIIVDTRNNSCKQIDS
jgi:hypothetical protein